MTVHKKVETNMSNRLPLLAADLAKLHNDIEAHTLASAEKAIAAGRMLTEAKALAGHGGWLPFLAGTGIKPRTAQRYMRLAASPLNATLLTHLGGITGALEFLARWKVPPPGEALFIGCDIERAAGMNSIAFVWEDAAHPGYYRVFAVFGDDEEGELLAYTKRPMPWLVTVEGDQPVDTVLTFLEAAGFPMTLPDWEISTVEQRLVNAVLGTLAVQ